jgi:8-oxo-dGTP diphosphatase
MTRFSLQFGQTQPGLIYRERMSVYGLCSRGETLAITRIGKAAPFDYDLPGGGIEADEDEAAALMREFQEEAGLTVWPIRIIGRAGQYWLAQGEARNSWRRSMKWSSLRWTASRPKPITSCSG